MIKYFYFFTILAITTLSIKCSALNRKHKDSTIIIFHNGLKRTSIIYKPAKLISGKTYPLLIALHGGHGTGKSMMKLTEEKFNKLADKENFIVLYPNGIGKNWNDGRQNMPKSYKAHNQNIDDVGFISVLIDAVVKKYCADPKRVYITGMSNGSMMTERLAIELSYKIAAAAPVCGNIPIDLKTEPKFPVAILIINGTKDPLVPYNGGYVHFFRKKLGQITSTNQTIDFWLKHNENTNTAVVSELPNTYMADNCLVRKTTYGKPSEKGEVILITIEGGGHTWPGGWQYLNKFFIGKTCRDIDACEIIWEFCKAHSR